MLFKGLKGLVKRSVKGLMDRLKGLVKRSNGSKMLLAITIRYFEDGLNGLRQVIR